MKGIVSIAKSEEPDLASLVSLEISAMDQAIEEVSERDSLMSRSEEPDLPSLVSLEVSAMDQAIEEVSERDSLRS